MKFEVIEAIFIIRSALEATLLLFIIISASNDKIWLQGTKLLEAYEINFLMFFFQIVYQFLSATVQCKSEISLVVSSMRRKTKPLSAVLKTPNR
jgi:hypothetical protein